VTRLLKPASMAGLILLAWVCAHASPVAQDRQLWRLAATTPGQVEQWEPRIARMVADGDLKLRSVTPDALLPGRVHERYDQHYRGVPVAGGDIAREIDGATLSIFGQLYQGIDVDTTPTLSAEQAREHVAQATGIAPAAERETRLVVLPGDDGGFDLAYEVHAGSAARFKVYFVDAHTGATLREMTDLEAQAAVGQGTGVLGDSKKMSASPLGGVYVADDKMRPPQLVTFDLKGNLTRTNQILDAVIRPIDSDKATDSDNVWTDGAAVDGHTYLGWTYDYYYLRLNRRGLDDNSAAMFGIVHPVKRENMLTASADDFGTYYVNAFWCGGCGSNGAGMMMFGEGMMPGYVLAGSGQYVDYLAGSLDVVGHELTHGVIDYSSRLAYRNESGALNEAFADMMGTSVEFFRQPRAADVNTGSNTTMTADYVMGEDSFRAKRSGSISGIRSLANPSAFSDPDHYSKRLVGPADEAHDWGYVHANSTIASHAFYLAIEGGTNRTSGVTVQGVGDKNRDQIEKIFYRAFVYKLTANATFSAARLATIQSAREVSGAGSLAEQAVTQAWNAVGVTDTSSNTVSVTVPDDARSRALRLLERTKR
jgi:bacillolysin